jgi:4-hydroxybenzoate polyprenyltransferase
VQALRGRRLAGVVRAGHPEPSAAVTLVAAVLAVSAGRGAETMWVAAAVLAGQLSVGWSNDWADRDRDLAAGRADKPIPAGDVAAGTVRSLAVGGVAVALALSLLSGAAATGVHALGLALGWAYNLRLKSTAASVVPYAVAFALLPAFVTLGLPDRPWPPWWALTAAGLLGAGAHFTNALPDLAGDTSTGVRGLPHRLGAAGSLAAAVVLLNAGAAAVATAPGLATRLRWVALGVPLALTAAVVLAVSRGRARTAFRLTIAIAVSVAAAFLAAGGRLA